MTIKIIKLEKYHCPKCDAMRPMFESIADEIAAAGAVVEVVNTDRKPEAIEKYDISSVPVFVFEKDGREVHRLSGLVKPFEIFSAIETAKEAR